VADQHTAKPPASKAVFINCPFDDGFKPIFRAIVFTILSSGYFPRCALDATDGAEIRISKIAEMIGECDWGIHDLSRIEVDAAGVPRFNMPMELGIHLGARLLGAARHKRKRALILEAKPHRYDAALSDISGQDIEVHANNPAEAIRCVRNWLSEHRTPKEPPLPWLASTTSFGRDIYFFRVVHPLRWSTFSEPGALGAGSLPLRVSSLSSSSSARRRRRSAA
jgi:hypothetical protein